MITNPCLASTLAPLEELAQIRAAANPSVVLPHDEVGYLEGVKFKLRVPGNWNGTVLIYLQGAKTTAPPAEPAIVPYALKDSLPALEPVLLSRGYALAASEIGTGEMQPKEELQDSHALLAYFTGLIGKPARVIVWGSSLGGVTTVQMAEDYPRSIDGAIAICGPLAGWARRLDFSLDFSLAYSVALGWPETWGPIGDLRDNLAADFYQEVVPKVVMPNAANRGRWEFVRLVLGMPDASFWQADPITGTPGMFLNMWTTTFLRESLEAYASGPVATNLGRTYELKPEEKTYLAGLGVNAEELLARMNAGNTIQADPRARKYIERYGALRGMPRKPLLTLHNTLDCQADVRSERLYRDEVAAANLSANLAQAYVKGIGHCAFSSTQLLLSLTAMEKWLDTGVKPDAAAFPESEGFDTNFVPAIFPIR